MSLQDRIKSWSQGNGYEDSHAMEKGETGNEEEINVKFSDPTDVMKTAQEMIKAIKEVGTDNLKEQGCDLTPEEIEAAHAERKAILEEMAIKVTSMQSHLKNREAEEIVEEAWNKWDEELT